ncbi:unnamed protein product (macronuclear) [Paramecium tetraurelia]|uniref:FYVE-type domain-containing protein n=1 Tax=Paramecium tetraurelia TaxID=5888 RepID=A0BRR5_PARTE|nr:uncharacterized protein GSPATT00031463001 [Paramecium tetraurelia]CAK61232.1 unnamed protein product [Paramecium tetraurelia]|eukprot:XP_001428630.1 hypothetical protein (macronuclear) [Paramecium tetraurelia strain d4-2]
MSSNKYIEQSPEVLSQRSSFRHSSFNQSVQEFSQYKEKMQDLMLPNVEFIDPQDFKKQNECFVCVIEFTQTNRQHHCRMCGSSCCGQCSQKTINKNRVCDICYMKASQITAEKKRNKFLQSLKDSAKKLKKHIEQAQKKKQELQNERDAQQDKQQIDLRILEKETEDYRLKYSQKTQDKCQYEQEVQEIKKKMSELNALKEQVQQECQEKEQEIRAYDTNLYLKEQELNDKKTQLQRLKQQKEELEILSQKIEQNPDIAEEISIPESVQIIQQEKHQQQIYNTNIDIDDIMYGNTDNSKESLTLIKQEYPQQQQKKQSSTKPNPQKQKDEEEGEEQYKCDIF